MNERTSFTKESLIDEENELLIFGCSNMNKLLYRSEKNVSAQQKLMDCCNAYAIK